MFCDQAWWEELVRVSFCSLLMSLLGFLFGDPMTYLIAGLMAYLVWHLYQVYRLAHWLESDKKNKPPFPIGIWKHINASLSAIRSQTRGRKRKLNRMLSNFMESTGALPDATVILNANGRVEWWNGVATEVLGLKKANRGERLTKVVTDPIFKKYLNGEDYRRPLHIPAPVNDSIGLEVRVVPYGKGKLLMQARDITRLLQLEMVRKDFVANVSHEIRTPLTVVKGYLEAMQDSTDEAMQPWSSIVDQMNIQTSRIQRIVADLLLISRLETGQAGEKMGVVSVPDILRSVVRSAEELSGDDAHKIHLEADERLLLIGQAMELESTFSNLVFNAVRYTPAGGDIKVRWWMGGSGPRFSVTDTGIGFNSVHLPRLTERFYRVDVGRSRERGGTGLGLAIVKHVLTRHDAHLDIESEPGHGSTFTCCFPHSRMAS